MSAEEREWQRMAKMVNEQLLKSEIADVGRQGMPAAPSREQLLNMVI